GGIIDVQIIGDPLDNPSEPAADQRESVPQSLEGTDHGACSRRIPDLLVHAVEIVDADAFKQFHARGERSAEIELDGQRFARNSGYLLTASGVIGDHFDHFTLN